jgi:hypothetical protein
VKIGVAIVMGIVSVTGSLIAAATRLMLGFAAAIISSGVGNARNAINTVKSAIIGATASAISWLFGAGRSVVVGLGSGIQSAAGTARSAIGSVKSAVIGAFSGAGGWLVAAGRNIINGLISGIQAGFGRVQGLLSSLTSMLPDWKGPAEVDKKILEDSGRMVIDGFGRGMASEVGAIKKQLGDLTGDLPTFTTPSSARSRGSDGASAGSPVTLTIMPGAIVVHGQGRDAGEQAAEAILERLGQAASTR